MYVWLVESSLPHAEHYSPEHDSAEGYAPSGLVGHNNVFPSISWVIYRNRVSIAHI